MLKQSFRKWFTKEQFLLFFNSTTSSSNNQSSALSKPPAAATTQSFGDDFNSPLIQEDGDSKVLKLRFDVSQYAPEEIVVKTVDQKLLVKFSSFKISKFFNLIFFSFFYYFQRSTLSTRKNLTQNPFTENTIVNFCYQKV